MFIPKQQTKAQKQDFVAEIPDHVAKRLRWYRRHILPRLNASPDGDLFVTRKGQLKSQDTITDQIIKIIKRHLGIHMTPHQFRHLCGHDYIEENPQDLETVRTLLGHASSKTTQIYVGSSSRRGSRAYNKFLFEKREALKLKRKVKRRPQRKPEDHPDA